MKLSYIFVLLFGLMLHQTHAQRAEADQLKTSKGNVTIQPVLHGTLVLSWNNQTIYVDPYGGPDAFAGLAAPDLILITDVHGDHLDTKTLEGLETGKATIVAPQAVADMLPEALKQKAVVLGNGAKTEQLGISIAAIPMYNLPEAEDAMHPKGRGNGYILTIGGKNIYISGDTEDVPEMRTLKNIDVAFVCMNLPYTMDIDQAASAVLAFKPKVVYPYHYRGQQDLSDVESFKNKVNAKDKKIEVRLRKWYPQS
ncbi:MBL fold metallo-hydrolase [Pontibacter sp. SGAir0037]|uniref:MBL fold metallo-hydrolase n=1 Tax=Pontibacter sp. SGAir0037 TaxID=2571030 RepID=UPI0010CD3CFC|nr:MBL fold metallo-hydrolase [Pontibacter sp. SGAir0037]QCR21345.1 MBL fold metallo-hydrolase [Pontibacter sp. SGAir0037]